MNPRERKPKILVVDDDADLLELLVDTLDTIGYEAVGASGGVEALAKLRESSYSLMITDIRMPDVDGLQLLKKVRRHYARMPVLFITGVATRDIIGQASPDGFLAKPFRISQIEQLIENALARKVDSFASRMPRVLIVDEDEEFRNTLADALSYSQCLPFHVPHAKAAMRELENGTIDAVITDYRLSDMDGVTLINSIKQRYPDMLAVLTGSSISPESIKGSAGSAAVDDVLSKPFRASEFLDLLGRHGVGTGTGAN
ncbi:MAG TPA: response regulator [Acidobacteriota bacterium]|nr:response regulator [Acidobacteriota bacterium]